MSLQAEMTSLREVNVTLCCKLVMISGAHVVEYEVHVHGCEEQEPTFSHQSGSQDGDI